VSVPVLTYSHSKCLCAVFFAVFRVCVLFLVNFNCLLFQHFASLFAQRAKLLVTRCAKCVSVFFMTYTTCLLIDRLEQIAAEYARSNRAALNFELIAAREANETARAACQHIIDAVNAARLSR